MRAVAVILVLLYHAGYAAFPGGFVGVDVFFVISGYLITRLLLVQMDAGTFSFARFYGRRVRRLAPALIATVVLTLLAACFIYSVGAMERLALEVYPVLLGIANFRFSISADYFSPEASQFTFLHTWSLAVEEQYYLFTPLITLLVYRLFSMRGLLIGACLIGLASFAAYLIVVKDDPTIAFYWPFFRIWEFVLGGVLVFFPLRYRWPIWLQQLAAAIGMALVVGSGVLLSAKEGGAGALLALPCIGACLVIVCSGETWIGKVLASRAFVVTGLISYSLYLVHWPIIMLFMRARQTGELLSDDRIPALFLSFVMAVIVYFAVEKRHRSAPGNRLSLGRFSAVTAAIVAVVFLVGLSINRGDGWSWRIVSQYAVAEDGYGLCRDKIDCVISETGETSLVLAGDSHAKHLAEGLALVSDRFEAKALTSLACDLTGAFEPRAAWLEKCYSLRMLFAAHLAATPDAKIVYAQRWRAYGTLNEMAAALQEFLEKHRTRKTLIIGQLHEVGDHQSLCGSVSDYIYDARLCEKPLSTANADSYNAALEKVVNAFPNATLIRPQKALCPDGICRGTIGKEPVFVDSQHISAFAARRLFENEVIPWLSK